MCPESCDEIVPGLTAFQSIGGLAEKLWSAPPPARYGLAFGFAVLVILIRVLLTPVWGVTLSIIVFSPAVLLAAWFGGLGPGLLATFVCALAAAVWFPPAPSLLVRDWHDIAALFVFIAIGAVMSAVIAALHRTGLQRTRLMQLEHEARAAAETANRTKDRFLAVLGHELRNPLHAISAAVQVIRTVETGDRVTRASDVIARQAEYLARLVEDLLDVSRVMNGRIQLDRRTLDLAAGIQRSLDVLSLAGKTERHHITLVAEPVWVEADAIRLEQITVNLVVNALKYTPEGGSIRVTVKQERQDAVLCVQDNGIGISADGLSGIFDLFVQEARTDGSPGGLGIGLAVVRSLVALHGGTVQAFSDGPGRGSTFTVRLPAVSQPVQELSGTTSKSLVTM
jgi:signal transduction histidine kinase